MLFVFDVNSDPTKATFTFGNVQPIKLLPFTRATRLSWIVCNRIRIYVYWPPGIHHFIFFFIFICYILFIKNFFFQIKNSGIDHEIRLWSPKSEEYDSENRVSYYDQITVVNQQQMQADPFELSATGNVCRAS